MLNRDNPRLSIVMPAYNHADMVCAMIDSILTNTYTDWELLVVDDGSGQETLDALCDYAQKDFRIHLIKRDRLPKGAQTCRNIGFKNIKGEYVIFFDSDDYISPECLQTRVDAIASREDLDFMVFPSGIVQNNEYKPDATLFAYGYQIYNDDIKAFTSRTLPFVVWNNIYRTESLKKYNIHWDEQLLSLQDADFNLRAILSGMKYEYYSCNPHFGYRIDANVDSVSKKIVSPQHQQSHLYAIMQFYSLVQSKYQHKYDNALYNGCLVMYNRIFNTSVDFDFANKMVDIVQLNSPDYGRLFAFQVRATKLLNMVLPAKMARQIPMLLFLVKSYIHKYYIKPNKIKRTQII